MVERHFWSGNIAIAEGALRAGLKFYAGYPITPSSDLMEYISRELPRRGGIFIQGEDEIASINMAIGASIAGLKAMTATSGPGFSLMQEALGLAIMLEIPIVVVDVMRLGPSTGQATKSGMGDVMQARWGRHGDQSLVVLAASSPRKAFYKAVEAFNISERLRTPVILLIDELTSHLWETVIIDDRIEVVDRIYGGPDDMFFDSSDPSKPPPMPRIGEGYYVLYTSSTHNGYGVRKTQDPEVHSRLVRRLNKKIWYNTSQLFKLDVFPDPDVDGGDIALVSYCSAARACREAVDMLSRDGFRAFSMELETLWPMDYRILARYLKDVSLIIVPEMNLGQIVYDIRLVAGMNNVVGYSKVGGGIPIFPDELCRFIKEVIRR